MSVFWVFLVGPGVSPFWGLGIVLISRMDVHPLEDWHRGFIGQFPCCNETLDQEVSLDTHCGEQGKNQIGAPSSDCVSSHTASGEGHRGHRPHSYASESVGHVLWMGCLIRLDSSKYIYWAFEFADHAKTLAGGQSRNHSP